MNQLCRLKSWTKARIKRLTATTSKTAIAVLSAVILILVASISLFKSARFFCEEHPGILIVVIAVAGEVICDWNRKKSLKERLKKFFGMLLVGGLLLEIAEVVKSDRKVAIANLEARQAESDAGVANERASTNELAAKQLERQLNDTKTALANAETRLNQSVKALQDITSPMDIGNEDSLGEELGAISGIGVEIRTSTDANAQHTADDLTASFFVAKWPILNRSFIGDIGARGIVVGSAWDDNSVKAANLLLKVLIERNIPAQISSPMMIGKIPTNSVIIAVMQRPDETNAQIIIAQSKTVIDQDAISEIQPEIWKLEGEKFVIGSKELSDAQARFDNLAAQYKSLNEDLSENENKWTTLAEEQQKAEEGTNFDKPGFHIGGGIWRGVGNFWSGPKESNTVIEVHNVNLNPEILQ